VTLALLFLAAAVVLTVISLQDGRKQETVGGSPAIGSSTPSPTPGVPDASDASADGVTCVLADSGGMTCPRRFTVEGSSVGLYPGATVQLPLRIENPNQEDLLVTAITVSVTETSASTCDVSNLQASDYSGPGFIIRANDGASLSLSLTMTREAPDPCQGVIFTLAYAGEAEPA
jgi:hypothetical protein